MNPMAAELKRAIRIWLLQLKNAVMRRMAYRSNFFLLGVGGLVQMALTLVFIRVIFGFVNNIAGWSFDQALVVVASYMMVEGLIWATCSYLFALPSHIRQGTLDYVLVKPIDSQFLVSIWRADPEDWIRVITAFGVLFYSLNNVNFSFSLLINIFFYAIFLMNAYLIIYSISLFIRSISFWTLGSNSLWIVSDNLTKLSQYPTDIFMHKTVRLFFSSIIPLAFIATVPAKILLHGPKLDLIFSSFFITIILFLSSRKFFHYALKHYSSASS